jgi:hypothetical protein
VVFFLKYVLVGFCFQGTNIFMLEIERNCE